MTQQLSSLLFFTNTFYKRSKRFHMILLLVVGSSLHAFCQAPTDEVFDSLKIVAAGSKLLSVSKQFSFTEGPAVDKKGNIFFTDQPNDKIWKYDIYGKLSLFMDSTGRSNGLYFDK